MPMNQEGRPRGIASVTFKTDAAVAAALKFDQTDYGGRILHVSVAKVGEGHNDKGKQFEVFVGGLPVETDEASLRKDFAECGDEASAAADPRR